MTVTNYRALERRYAKEIPRAIDLELMARCHDIVDDRSTVLRLGHGRVKIVNMLWAGMNLSKTGESVQHLLGHIAAAGGLLSLAALELTVERSDGTLGITALRIPASEGQMHIEHASQMLNAMVKGQLAFSFESVFNINDGNNTLYDECLARVIVPESSCAMMPASFIPSIERAGLMSEFDQTVVSSVIDRLVSDCHLVLGCNISAQSAVESHWWTAIFERLQRLPEVARRLVIEITETAPLVPSRGREFARRLNSLGCRIAIDDFGAGYGVQTGVQIGTPDIVKLDAFFLRDAKGRAQGVERLLGLADLARYLSSTVVVEGVEDSMAVDIVRLAGCEWAQGHLRGKVIDPVLRDIHPSRSDRAVNHDCSL